jgi:hypothetical protein
VKNGLPQFEEQAAAYGLDAPGTYTTQCAFFDMDRDGDLDAFMVNHADMFYNVFYNTTQLRKLRHPQFGNRLYRNDNGRFTEISELAGITGSGINFGLGVAIDDVNGDHWPDVYVTNDYNEQDFLYINQKDGTFKEVLKQSMGHISQFSMGVDMSDLNNDGRNDVVSLDMLPEDNYRQKLLKGPEGYDYYQLMADSGYHHQNMRNMLQLNMGVAPDGLPRFSEIGQLAGISNTDWSWSPLVADFDNDGFKDLYVTNGYLRDFTNMDFLKYTFAEAQAAAKANGDTAYAWKVITDLQGTKIANYAFHNNGRLQFTNMAEKWGLADPSISTGAAYADLDNDGDLELIINNTNEAASIYENKQNDSKSFHSLQIRLKDTTKNVFAIGATVRLFSAAGMQQQTVFPARGFQSSSSSLIHFGLGQQTQIDSVQVWWPEGNTSVYYQLKPDSMNELKPQQGDVLSTSNQSSIALFSAAPNNAGIDYVHMEDGFVDFKRLMGLPHQISRQGPFMAVDDVNDDKLDDVFVGGSDLQPGRLFIQNVNGSFSAAAKQPWQQSRVPDGGVCFFDADADGDNDLYVARHGMQLNENDFAFQHQLYLNDGKGNFSLTIDALPEMRVSSTVVTAADYNKDGKTDLLVACRSVPGRFPVIPTTYLLRNESSGKQVKFEYASEQKSELIRQPGLVTCAVWTDVNKDAWPDLLVAGEYMPITLFINERGQLKARKGNGFDNSNGWWCRLAVDDLDNDGDIDLVSGNAGLNMQMKAGLEKPVTLYYNDFDRNGLIDPVLTYYIGDKQVPALGLDDLAEETPVLRKKFIRYEPFAKASWSELYDEESKKGTLELNAFELQSCWWENDGEGHFTKHVLPLEAQFSMLQGLVVMDVDKDAKKDLVVAGNYYPWRTQWGRMDASYGWVLRNTGKAFVPMYPSSTGLWLGGDLRDLQMIKTKGLPYVAATRYDGPMSVVIQQK